MKNASSLLRVLALAALAACTKAPPDGAHGDPQKDPTRCATCHLPEYRATTHPPHPDARPTTCGVCHLQTSWGHWRVDHPWWELTGAHARAAADKALAGKENQVKCFWCHRGDPATWKDTKKECISCHEDDRETSTFPDHETFSTQCETCHTTETWKGGKKPPRVVQDAGPPPEADAGADAGAKPVKPRPIPTPTTRPTTPPVPTPTTRPTTPPVVTPTTPTGLPPDVVVHPSRRR